MTTNRLKELEIELAGLDRAKAALHAEREALQAKRIELEYLSTVYFSNYGGERRNTSRFFVTLSGDWETTKNPDLMLRDDDGKMRVADNFYGPGYLFLASNGRIVGYAYNNGIFGPAEFQYLDDRAERLAKEKVTEYLNQEDGK